MDILEKDISGEVGIAIFVLHTEQRTIHEYYLCQLLTVSKMSLFLIKIVKVK